MIFIIIFRKKIQRSKRGAPCRSIFGYLKIDAASFQFHIHDIHISFMDEISHINFLRLIIFRNRFQIFAHPMVVHIIKQHKRTACTKNENERISVGF